MNNAWKINDGDKSYTKGWGNDSASPAKPVAQHYKSSVFAGNERPATQSKGRDLTGSTDVNELINEVRDRLKARGARAFIGLQRQFKIMDDDNSKSLDVSEFKKAISDFKIGLNPDQA